MLLFVAGLHGAAYQPQTVHDHAEDYGGESWSLEEFKGHRLRGQMDKDDDYVAMMFA